MKEETERQINFLNMWVLFLIILTSALFIVSAFCIRNEFDKTNSKLDSLNHNVKLIMEKLK